MLKHITSIVFALILYASSFAQCNCAENFEFVQTRLKANYAGWIDKTTSDPEGFERFTEQQRLKAKNETQKNYCYKIIHDWLNYFKDRHTHLYNASVTNLQGKTDEEIRAYFSQSEKIEISENETISSMDASSRIEGIWEMEGGNYRVAIIKNKNANRDFAGVVLRADSAYWMPGQVKMELTEIAPGQYSSMFYMRDHSLRFVKTELDGVELKFEGLNTFKKVYPPSTGSASVKSDEIISGVAEMKKLNSSTFYFRLPTFNHRAKNAIDSTLQANHDLLTETPNLIIDVRNNGGGSDISYAELIRYLYTNEIKVVNNSIWSSEDNIQKFKDILNDPAYPSSGKRYIQNLVKKLENNPGTFVKKKDDTFRGVKILPLPATIVILINRNCGSSCEEFVLAARQSKKVTLMGENTMGVLDYANVHSLTLPCSDWILQYATSRSNRLPDFPVDNIGIEPEVKIPKEKNWVEFAMEYLKYKQ